MENSIITNSTGGDCSNTGGGFSSATGNNLIDDNAVGACRTISSAAESAGLGALADNGGPTLTHALLAGSNAIDTGASSCPDDGGADLMTDQRGAARPFNTTCDIGAYEVHDIQTAGTCGGAALTGLQTFTFASGNVTVDITNGNGLTCLSVEEMGPGASHPAATAGVMDLALMTNNWWHITGDVTTGLDVDVTLPFSAADADTRACKWPGGLGGYGWDCDDGSNTSHIANISVTRMSVTSFSDWAVGDNVGPTAVTLQSISATTTAIPVAVLLLVMFVLLLSWRLVRRRETRIQ